MLGKLFRVESMRPPRFGYRVTTGGCHEEHPGEQRVLVLLRRLRAEGLSQKAITERLSAVEHDRELESIDDAAREMGPGVPGW